MAPGEIELRERLGFLARPIPAVPGRPLPSRRPRRPSSRVFAIPSTPFASRAVMIGKWFTPTTVGFIFSCGIPQAIARSRQKLPTS